MFDVNAAVVRVFVDMVPISDNIGQTEQTLSEIGYLWIGGVPLEGPSPVAWNSASSLELDPQEVFSNGYPKFSLF